MSFESDLEELKKKTIRQLRRRNLEIEDWQYRCEMAMHNGRRFIYIGLSWVVTRREWLKDTFDRKATIQDALDCLSYATKMRLITSGAGRSGFYNDVIKWRKAESSK